MFRKSVLLIDLTEHFIIYFYLSQVSNWPWHDDLELLCYHLVRLLVFIYLNYQIDLKKIEMQILPKLNTPKLACLTTVSPKFKTTKVTCHMKVLLLHFSFFSIGQSIQYYNVNQDLQISAEKGEGVWRMSDKLTLNITPIINQNTT